MKRASSGVFVLAILLCIPRFAPAQTLRGDPSLRQAAAKRISEEHGIQLDWRRHTLHQLTDAELRLEAVERIREEFGVQYDWRKSSLSSLTDAERRMEAARRISRTTGRSVDWRKHSFRSLSQAERSLSDPSASPVPVPSPRMPGAFAPQPPRLPSLESYAGYPPDSTSGIRADADHLSWEIRKLRRNAGSYDADEYARRLRRLEYDAEDLSSRAGAAGAGDAASRLDNAAWDLGRVRRRVELDEGYFERERESEIGSRMRRIEWDTDDAGRELD